ncbi:hypothetical protein F5Y10DRAFT_273126 [Nemania abortiva]|nr:hypothetical protein F5Y10DRAFT_273126 [Nemania abortiva]
MSPDAKLRRLFEKGPRTEPRTQASTMFKATAKSVTSRVPFRWGSGQVAIFEEWVLLKGPNVMSADLTPLLRALDLDGYEDIKNKHGECVHDLIIEKVRRKLARTKGTMPSWEVTEKQRDIEEVEQELRKQRQIMEQEKEKENIRAREKETERDKTGPSAAKVTALQPPQRPRELAEYPQSLDKRGPSTSIKPEPKDTRGGFDDPRPPSIRHFEFSPQPSGFYTPDYLRKSPSGGGDPRFLYSSWKNESTFSKPYPAAHYSLASNDGWEGFLYPAPTAPASATAPAPPPPLAPPPPPAVQELKQKQAQKPKQQLPAFPSTWTFPREHASKDFEDARSRNKISALVRELQKNMAELSLEVHRLSGGTEAIALETAVYDAGLEIDHVETVAAELFEMRKKA